MRGSILYCNGEGLTAGTSKGLCSEASSLASYNFTYNIAAIKKNLYYEMPGIEQIYYLRPAPSY